jgi:hypothetical protein
MDESSNHTYINAYLQNLIKNKFLFFPISGNYQNRND